MRIRQDKKGMRKMVKNIQLKIILSFMVLGILAITLTGCFSIYQMKYIQDRTSGKNKRYAAANDHCNDCN